MCTWYWVAWSRALDRDSPNEEVWITILQSAGTQFRLDIVAGFGQSQVCGVESGEGRFKRVLYDEGLVGLHGRSSKDESVVRQCQQQASDSITAIGQSVLGISWPV